ncbi:MAG: TIM barrel protein [Chloroflexi bacterium]|nr:MAG: TIM barrel protein [Chloroflexota bacterium]TMF80029.1 MAG: TIM barrel protein [Chloroflexota bacterium]
MRERRTASDHFGSGRAARHSAVRGRGRGASKSHAPSSTLRAGDGNGSQRTLVTEARDVVIANAPVSYGAFELTVGILPGVPDGDTVLDEVAGAGYAGIDLGPLGYFGLGDDLAVNLARRGLALSGGFFELPFSDHAKMPAALRELGSLLDVFDTVGAKNGLKPRPTLADVGSDLRRSKPGQAASDRSLGFDAEGWKRFAEGVEMAVACCRERGYVPTFHHETGTHVEAPWEIERVLEDTSIGLCLDTGHLLLGGGDPVRAIREWRGRINHFHLKDARRQVVEGIVREAAPVSEIWRRKAFCRLGEGDLDVDAVLEAIRDSYAGWIVVEQDVLPDPDGTAAADQRANREYLAARGF